MLMMNNFEIEQIKTKFFFVNLRTLRLISHDSKLLEMLRKLQKELILR